MYEAPSMIKSKSKIKLDLFFVVVFNIAALLFFANIDTLGWLYHYSLAHQGIEVGEIIVLFVTLSLSLGVFALRRWKEGNQLIEHIHELATKDALTGAYNRRYMDLILEHESERSKRSQQPFSLLLLDIDYFKKINDTYGHHIGDNVLIELFNTLNTSTRSIDISARWGGEEFLILCPNTDAQSAKVVGSKLLEAIQKTTFEKVGEVTASIGIATFHNRDNVEQILKRADSCLYYAKDHGRNQVRSDIILG